MKSTQSDFDALMQRISPEQRAGVLVNGRPLTAHPGPARAPTYEDVPPGARGARAAKPGKGKRGMNATEKRYAEILDRRLRAGLIRWYAYERVTFKLGDDTRFTVDFMVWHNDGSLEAIEVKGRHIWEDSKIKFRVAPAIIPWVKTWTMMQYDKDRGWVQIKQIERGAA